MLAERLAAFVSPYALLQGCGDNSTEIHCSISGGKDSTAAYLLLIEKGLKFRATFADTGHEDKITYDFIRALPEKTGGPPIETVRSDFSAEFARKRRFVERQWPRHGVPNELVARALRALQPTGNPFLDLCILKGRFPSAKARFCTDRLKSEPLFLGTTLPLLREGVGVVSVQAVRKQESLARSLLPPWQRLNTPLEFKPKRHGLTAQEVDAFVMYAFRPLLEWTVEEVFEMHERHGLRPNPLYGRGMHRVGCMPCCMVSKEELRVTDREFPSAIEKIELWESIVSSASKRGCSTFFNVGDDPNNKHKPDIKLETHGIRNHVEWSKTSRGGVQYNMGISPAVADCALTCGQHGLCE